jgi:hypothetical protein
MFVTVITILASVCFGASFLYILWRQPQRLSAKDWLQYAFLARYQLLLLAFLLSFAWLATAPAANILKNLLVFAHWWEMAVAAWLAMILAWVSFFTLRVLVRSAPVRFAPLAVIQRPSGALGWFLTWSGFYLLAAIPVLTAAYVNSSDLTPIQASGGVIVGWLAAMLTGGAHRLLVRFSDPLQHWQQRVTGRVSTGLLEGVFRGYRFELGHGSSMLYLLITGAIYALGFILFRPDVRFFNFEPPAISYIFVLLIFLGWVLPGLAFFFDRYRLPVGAALVLFSAVVWAMGDSDYYYPVFPKTNEDNIAAVAPTGDLTPNLALQNWHKRHQEDTLPVVVVAASGGGIKAAVWTTVVLRSLQHALGPNFADHIVLISSVSGGSVGTLYYVDAYQTDGPPQQEDLDRVVAAAASPSLSSTAWGLVYPDVWRTVAAWPPGIWNRVRDRGWALEQAWKRYMLHPNATLDDWRLGVQQGVRPAVLFNATVVENGTVFAFTPLDERNASAKLAQFETTEMDAAAIQARRLPNQWRSVYFNTLYPKYTVEAATAARMSATFPYVSPIARPMNNGRPVSPDGYHLADGGYFDNHGVVSALEWLEAVRGNLQQQGRNILLIQIEASVIQQEMLSGPRENAGWLYSMAGPLVGAVNSQFTAQTWRNNQAINWLDRLYNEIRITPVTFVYDGQASLSWQLAKQEVKNIESAIDSPLNREALLEVCQSFYPAESSQYTRCQALSGS